MKTSSPLLFYLLSCVSITTGLQCYRCSSLNGEAACSDTEFGHEVTCRAPADKGCLITHESVEKGEEVFARDCSEETTASCQDLGDGKIHSCNCQTDLCNKDWASAGGSGQGGDTTSQTEMMKCYHCDSAVDNCTASDPGVKVDCPVQSGCAISIDAGEGNVMLRDCGHVTEESEFKCDTVSSVDLSLKYCNCKTELCNENWETAGDSDQMMKCYKCDSKQETCTVSDPGVKIDCPVQYGCAINQDLGEGGAMERDCAHSWEESDFKCETVMEGDLNLKYCKCDTELCNENWETAGSSASSFGAVLICVFVSLVLTVKY